MKRNGFKIAKILEVSEKHVHPVKMEQIFSEFAEVQNMVHNSELRGSRGYLHYAARVKSF
jgi:hypothetical protein